MNLLPNFHTAHKKYFRNITREQFLFVLFYLLPAKQIDVFKAFFHEKRSKHHQFTTEVRGNILLLERMWGCQTIETNILFLACYADRDKYPFLRMLCGLNNTQLY